MAKKMLNSIDFGTGDTYHVNNLPECNSMFQSWSPTNLTNVKLKKMFKHDGITIACTGSGLYYSNDGVNFTQSNVTSGYVHDCIFEKGLYVAPSSIGIFYSTDGITWTNGCPDGSFCSIIYEKGIFVAGSWWQNELGLYYSQDGINWLQSNVNKYSCRHIVYGNGVFVAACSVWGTSANASSGNPNGGLYYSTDGIVWNLCKKSDGSVLSKPSFSVHFADGKFVASCGYDNGLCGSSDGINFNLIGSGGLCYDAVFKFSNEWLGVTYRSSNVPTKSLYVFLDLFTESDIGTLRSVTNFPRHNNLFLNSFDVYDEFAALCVKPDGSSKISCYYVTPDIVAHEILVNGLDANGFGFVDGIFYATASDGVLYYTSSDQGKTIIVDSSGSPVWTKIHGRSKITVASSAWNDNIYSFEDLYSNDFFDIEVDFDYDIGTDAQYSAYCSAQLGGSFASNHIKAMGTVPTIDIPVVIYYTKKI